MRTFIFFILLVHTLGLKSQSFFKPEKLIETGVYYYPEAWDSSQWERDFKKMAEMGFEFTHFAEFAWAELEPTEGKYNFDWLDKAVELAAKYNLKVIMCTPTPTPPVWLTLKYPEVLIVNQDGIRAQHGTRAHFSWSSPKYRELAANIVTRMAGHYGKDNRIWGWQIDNEPSHYGIIDYSPAVRTSFIEWLKKKYHTIDNLNNAWGTVFWSGIYQSFDQIELPNSRTHGTQVASPHSYLDFKRFNADECAGFVSFQYNLLRKFISPDQFVTTNFMTGHPDVDPWRNKDLDFISYTAYPVGGYANGEGDQGFRMGDPWYISFANDFFRPLKGIAGVMELQPGQVNWGQYNPLPYPGVIRAWLWNTFAGGLRFACTYRFRQPLVGSELYHYGIIGTDGVTPTSGGEQYRQFITEIKSLRKMYTPGVVVPSEYLTRKTGILYSYDNLWDTDLHKQTIQWSYKGHVSRYYNSVKSLTVPVDFISEEADFSQYPVLIAPAYQLLDNELVNKWKIYIQNGGHLVLTCRTGQKNRSGHLFQSPWAAPIRELVGAAIPMYDVLPVNKNAKIQFDQSVFMWDNWGDILEPNPGTEVWATYADQFYAGKAAVVHRKLGKGTITYVGVDSDNGDLEKSVMMKVYASAGIRFVEQPEGLVVHWRDGFWVAINYSSGTLTPNMPDNATILIGSKKMGPADVLVWK